MIENQAIRFLSVERVYQFPHRSEVEADFVGLIDDKDNGIAAGRSSSVAQFTPFPSMIVPPQIHLSASTT